MQDAALRLFFEIHSGNPREGPGNFTATRRAYSLLQNLPEKPLILDIGCGPGMQTLDLARISPGTIYAIDNHDPYVERLAARVVAEGLQDRVFPQNADMDLRQFDHHRFDIIWAEGSIYIIGFEKGLTRWRRSLKPGGYLAVTEISWLKPHPPPQLREFWREAYPAMGDQATNLAKIDRCGYRPVDSFVLPADAWWEHYYTPIEKKLAALRVKYQHDAPALAVIAAEQQEIDLFRKYYEYYGYVFYIMHNSII